MVERGVDHARRHALGDQRAQRRLASPTLQTHPVAVAHAAHLGIVRVDLEPVFRVPDHVVGAPRLRADIVLAENAAGREQQREARPDPFVGRLTYFRVISGTLSGQGHVYNASRKQEERVGSFLAVQGKDQENLAKVGPGDIAAVAKLTSTAAGDTLVADRSQATELPGIEFPAPSLQVAIEPESKADLERLRDEMDRMVE